jgi:hypothetical protein
LAAALFLALTLVLAYPLTLRPASSLVWMGPDSELFAWTLAWNAHALATNPLSIFDANIFHPQRRTLAYSENLIGTSLFAAPVLWLTANPVLAVNVVALLSCVLCGVGAFVLAQRLGITPLGALLAGLVFAFSPPRFARIGQLHLTSVQWIPFALAALHAYLDEGRKRHLRVAAGLFTLQALTSGHGGTFLLIAMVALIGYRVALGEPVDLRRRVRDLGVSGILLLLPAVLVTLPYYLVQREIGLRRVLEPTWWSDWKLAAVSYVATPAHVPRLLLSPLVHQNLVEGALAFLFPGFMPLLLAAVALVRRRRRSAADRPARRLHAWDIIGWRALTALCAVAAIASIGLALYVTSGGRITLRTDEGVFLRVRTAWRPALLGAVLLAGAVAVARRANLPSLVVAAALRARAEAWRRWAEPRRRDALCFYAVLTAGTLWLSAGAPIGPWPYLYWLPGFNFIRVPSRFTILSLLGLAVLAGFGFDRLVGRMATRRRTVAATIACAWLVAEFAMMPGATVPYRLEIPAVDRWLDGQPKPFVVAELPFSGERDHTTYMLHSTAHWQKTINGYSGFRPPLFEEANPVIRGFPSEESLETLARLGVTYVVVHTDRYQPDQWPRVEEGIGNAGPWLTLMHADGAGRVYVLHRPNQSEGRPPFDKLNVP